MGAGQLIRLGSKESMGRDEAARALQFSIQMIRTSPRIPILQAEVEIS